MGDNCVPPKPYAKALPLSVQHNEGKQAGSRRTRWDQYTHEIILQCRKLSLLMLANVAELCRRK
jgi:hypothetical protein